MYVPRMIDSGLRAWSWDAGRKPLVLRGARQTGKTSAVRELGKQFDLFLELNLERFADLSLVRGCRSADELLAALGARHEIARFPDRTLLLLDEIQESTEAVSWLRFLGEDHPEIAVVAAGSLLEVRLEERGFSFPVGRVTFRSVRPFTLLEFATAVGRDVLASHIRDSVEARRGLSAGLHDQAMELMREYLLVGGMPEAVVRWAETRDPRVVRQVHADLVQAFAEDIPKYRGPGDPRALEEAFARLPHAAGQRIRYERFLPGFRAEASRGALAKLEGAMLLSFVHPTASLRLPLEVKPKAAPKLLPLDVGLMLHGLGGGRDLLRGDPLQAFDGRLAETFVGQQLLAAGDLAQLHFWVRETATAGAELDYLLPCQSGLLPVEVKAGTAGSLRSLHQFLHRAKVAFGVRLWSKPLAEEDHHVRLQDGELRFRLLSLPLYAAELTRACA